MRHMPPLPIPHAPSPIAAQVIESEHVPPPHSAHADSAHAAATVAPGPCPGSCLHHLHASPSQAGAHCVTDDLAVPGPQCVHRLAIPKDCDAAAAPPPHLGRWFQQERRGGGVSKTTVPGMPPRSARACCAETPLEREVRGGAADRSEVLGGGRDAERPALGLGQQVVAPPHAAGTSGQPRCVRLPRPFPASHSRHGQFSDRIPPFLLNPSQSGRMAADGSANGCPSLLPSSPPSAGPAAARSSSSGVSRASYQSGWAGPRVDKSALPARCST